MADQAATRRCIGSKRFGIEPHDAPVDDFPKQPSQKDGLGRMCKTHWNEYTAGLARDAKARTAAEASTAPEPDDVNPPEAEAAGTVEPERSRKRKTTQAAPIVDATAAEAEAG